MSPTAIILIVVSAFACLVIIPLSALVARDKNKYPSLQDGIRGQIDFFGSDIVAKVIIIGFILASIVAIAFGV